jgi:hypothetical protein
LLASQGWAACPTSQNCDLEDQQQRVEDLQRQTDDLRSSVLKNEQEVERARSDFRLQQSVPSPLQRQRNREIIQRAQDNLSESQRSYWQSQNELFDSQRTLQRMQQPSTSAPQIYQTPSGS